MGKGGRMYEKPEYDGNGEMVLSQENGKNREMLMDVRVKRLGPGEVLEIVEPEKETAVLLLRGRVEFCFDGRVEPAARENVFVDGPFCLHSCRGERIAVRGVAESRLLIQQTTNGKTFAATFYTPRMCTLEEFGKGKWNGTAHRQVLTVFDYSNEPWSNLVLGETFHEPGCWTSYPPHYHPQPELYYYEFDKPQGFGVGFCGEDCYKVGDQGCLTILPMHPHQQVCAPGYRMYFAWLIRHLDGDPWRKTRIDVPEHAWLNEAP